MAGFFKTIRTAFGGRFENLDSDTILFFSSVEVDETWTRTTALACAAAGLPVVVGIVGAQPNVDRIAQYYRRSRVPVFCVSEAMLRGSRANIVVTASSGVSRGSFSERLKHLVHMPHSLISFHMAYPANAFDDYDMIFAAGPHHVAEIAALRQWRNLPAAATRDVGYGKFDGFGAAPRDATGLANDSLKVLLAPSWGPHNILAGCGPELVQSVLQRGFELVVRPHPMFYSAEPALMEQIVAAGQGFDGFQIENPNAGDGAIFDADVLITDYSGIALEFAALRRRPIVFVDVARKVFNPDWQALKLDPVEVAMRTALGVIVPADTGKVVSAVEQVSLQADEIGQSIAAAESAFLFRSESCGQRAARELSGLRGAL